MVNNSENEMLLHRAAILSNIKGKLLVIRHGLKVIRAFPIDGYSCSTCDNLQLHHLVCYDKDYNVVDEEAFTWNSMEELAKGGLCFNNVNEGLGVVYQLLRIPSEEEEREKILEEYGSWKSYCENIVTQKV